MRRIIGAINGVAVAVRIRPRNTVLKMQKEKDGMTD